MIPIALSGDRSYNKDNVRKYVVSGNSLIQEHLQFILMKYLKNEYLIRLIRWKYKGIYKESYISLKEIRSGRIQD